MWCWIQLTIKVVYCKAIHISVCLAGHLATARWRKWKRLTTGGWLIGNDATDCKKPRSLCFSAEGYLVPMPQNSSEPTISLTQLYKEKCIMANLLHTSMDMGSYYYPPGSIFSFLCASVFLSHLSWSVSECLPCSGQSPISIGRN